MKRKVPLMPFSAIPRFSEVHAHPGDAYVDEGAFIAYASERAFNYRVAGRRP